MGHPAGQWRTHHQHLLWSCTDLSGWSVGNLTEARVVCRQLGFPFTKSVDAGYYGPGSGRIWLTDVSCSGEEDKLKQCSHHKVEGPLQNCGHHDDIGVMCYMGELSACVCACIFIHMPLLIMELNTV